ncbi:MAG: Uncharacterized protein G01um101413_771 [Parcubacteria group bacterium Gr01-1014_13]|nr:MAG: Uncharacterized protein G01um101413_771 [Parcubacteria group bacterium Gr01-1014_13]
MALEIPSFSSKPLTETDAPETKPKRKGASSPRKKREPKKSEEGSNKQTKLSRQLTQIYQDNEGHLPDMRKIKIKKNHSGFKTFFVVVFIGGLLAAVAWAGLFLMPNSKKFAEGQINLSIAGPENIISGTATTYTISYENNQSLALKKATLNVQYPQGFIFLSSDVDSNNSGHTEWQLDEIGAHKKREIKITGLTYGSLNQTKSWRAFLTYKPENFGSELQKASFLNVTVAKSPYSLGVSGSNKAITGNTAEYSFTVKKEEASEITKLELKPSWPQNFYITSSSPALSKDSKWTIEPNKDSSSDWTFKITGKFSSSTANSGDISGVLSTINNKNTFTLADAKATTELTQNDLDLNLAINGSLTNFSSQPGDNLNITLSLKNQSANDLKNVSLKLILEAPSAKRLSLLDWGKISDKFDGDIRGIQINDDVRSGEITWGKAKVADLAKINKNQEVGLDIQLPIKNDSSFDLSALKGSSQIKAVAEVSFKDADNVSHTYSSNQIIITVNSDLKFEARDSASGEKHQISWVLTNNFHPLKNISLSADVYGDAKVELPTPTPAGEVTFDSSNKKITWTIAEMPQSVDTLALPITITLNKVNPTQQLLISKVHIQAEDTVTGEKLDFMGEEVGLNQ